MDITRTGWTHTRHDDYSIRPANIFSHPSENLRLVQNPVWGSGAVASSSPAAYPIYAIEAYITYTDVVVGRRRRSSECFFTQSVPHLTQGGEGVAAAQCGAHERMHLHNGCPSGAACVAAHTVRCAKTGACDLGKWAPCVHAPGCYTLPPAWPLAREKNYCPDMCPENHAPSSDLHPCTSPGSVLPAPVCKRTCQEPPRAPPNAGFYIVCPPTIATTGLPCEIRPRPGMKCSPARAGCSTDVASVKCRVSKCYSNMTSTRRTDTCFAGAHASVAPHFTCERGERVRSCRKDRRAPQQWRAAQVPRVNRRPPPAPPEPRCCPSGTGNASYWNGVRCACVLEHIGYRTSSNDCCRQTGQSLRVLFTPWKLQSASLNTQFMPCKGSGGCKAVGCIQNDGCYGFTKKLYLISNGSWVDGGAFFSRLRVEL